MGPSQGPKRIWLIPPASTRVGVQVRTRAGTGINREYGETNAAGSDLGKGPSPPKKGEGVPREALGLQMK